MEQKDIDRLLAGRKAIDEIKRPDVDVVNTLNLTTKKSEAVSLTTVKQSLAELDALRKTESDSIIEAERQIIELGFSGIGDFMSFNEKMCFDAFKECRPVQGSCDLCKGNVDEKGNLTGKMCEKTVGIGICEKDVFEAPDKVLEYIYLSTFKSIKRFGVSLYKRDGNISRGICPDGHGFYVDETLCKPFPFTLFWRGFHGEMLDEITLNEIRSNLDADGKWTIYKEEIAVEGINTKDKK